VPKIGPEMPQTLRGGGKDTDGRSNEELQQLALSFGITNINVDCPSAVEDLKRRIEIEI